MVIRRSSFLLLFIHWCKSPWAPETSAKSVGLNVITIGMAIKHENFSISSSFSFYWYIMLDIITYRIFSIRRFFPKSILTECFLTDSELLMMTDRIDIICCGERILLWHRGERESGEKEETPDRLEKRGAHEEDITWSWCRSIHEFPGHSAENIKWKEWKEEGRLFPLFLVILFLSLRLLPSLLFRFERKRASRWCRWWSSSVRSSSPFAPLMFSPLLPTFTSFSFRSSDISVLFGSLGQPQVPLFPWWWSL